MNKALAVLLITLLALGSFTAGLVTSPKVTEISADFKIQALQDDPRYTVIQHLESMYPWLFVIDIDASATCSTCTGETVGIWIWYDRQYFLAMESETAYDELYSALAFTAELVSAYFPDAIQLELHWAEVLTVDVFEGRGSIAKSALSVRGPINVLLEWGKGETTIDTFIELAEKSLVEVYMPSYFQSPLYHETLLPRASHTALPWE